MSTNASASSNGPAPQAARQMRLPFEKNVYEAVHAERERAHSKHFINGGSMEHLDPTDPRWLPVLTEEVGEVARVLCELNLGNISTPKAYELLEKELTQVSAMSVAWLSTTLLTNELRGGYAHEG
jgi:hypothetical protein